MPHISILNGPNLNLLGKRKPEIYGKDTLADIEASCRKLARELSLDIGFEQSNSEGKLVDWIQEARDLSDAVIINPAAYTHTSVAIFDALEAFEGTVVEVHLSNIHKREEWRHKSYVSLRADALIAGCGAQGYLLAMHHVTKIIS